MLQMQQGKRFSVSSVYANSRNRRSVFMNVVTPFSVRLMVRSYAVQRQGKVGGK